MEEQAISGVSHLLNYGVLGIFSVIMLIVIWQMWKHLRLKDKETNELTKEFTKIVTEFRTQSMAEAAANRDVLKDLKDVIHSKL